MKLKKTDDEKGNSLPLSTGGTSPNIITIGERRSIESRNTEMLFTNYDAPAVTLF